MTRRLYRYDFDEEVPQLEVETSLLLAQLAAEAIEGFSPVDPAKCHKHDKVARTVLVDATSKAGRVLRRVFSYFLELEFCGQYRVRRVRARPSRPQQAPMGQVGKVAAS